MKISIPDFPDSSSTTKSFLDIDIIAKDNRSTAKICLVGDPPDTYECIEKSPFNGTSYKQFHRLCSAINIPKHQMYLTNSIKAKTLRKLGKDLSGYPKMWTAKGYRCPEWGELQMRLIEELSGYDGKIIVCMGNTALQLLLDTPDVTSVAKYRGSVYRTEDFPHLKDTLPDKFIAVTYSVYDCSPRMKPANFYILMNDLQKFIKLNDEPELMDIKPVIHTAPSFDEAIRFLDQVMQCKETAVDIEATPSHVTCFALTISEIEGMCIPLMNNQGNYWTASQEAELWCMFSEIMADPKIEKFAQNGMFDCMFLLRTLGIKTANFTFDTMIAQHICWTDLPKGLDFLVSVYSYFPYYKDEGKQSHLKAIKNWPKYWEYNCKDAIYTHFIVRALIKEITQFNAWDDFDYMMNLHAPLMEMEWNGILTEQDKIIKEKYVLERKMRALQHGINKLAKRELNTNSSKQMIAYFYGHCMIKPYVNRTTGNATCDAVALSRIARKKVRGSAEAKMIMNHRKLHKLVSTYFRIVVDDDQRLRCNHQVAGTGSGRISTNKTYFGTGTNLQNQPEEFKKYLRADEEWILTELDLAKAEAHCVAFLCQDANMIHSFESGIDVHSFNASKIFDVPIEEVTKEAKEGKVPYRRTKRYMGKKVVHASNYAMGSMTFSDNLAKEDVFMSKGECAKLLKAYQIRFPGLRKWHRSIDRQVSENRVLYNMFGRPKRFLGMLEAATFRNAYSYIPQSTVAELLNRGMIAMYHDPTFHLYDMRFKMLATVHDSVIIQTPKKYVNALPDIYRKIHEHMTHEFTHKGRKFTIGLDAKIGTNWDKKMIELDDFEPDTVYDACKSLNFM